MACKKTYVSNQVSIIERKLRPGVCGKDVRDTRAKFDNYFKTRNRKLCLYCKIKKPDEMLLIYVLVQSSRMCSEIVVIILEMMSKIRSMNEILIYEMMKTALDVGVYT